MPCSAPFPVPTIMATGVASPKAQGQEMTSTAMPVDKAKSNGYPTKSHITVVNKAMMITTGTKIRLILSAILDMGALDAEASSTKRIIWAKVVSAPTFVALKGLYLPLPSLP